MKPLTLKLSAILIAFLFTGLGCQEDEEWEDIVLNNSVCENTTGVSYSFTGYSGVIDTFSTGNPVIVIRGTEPEFIEDVVFLPCNLPASYHQPGLEINFSGDVLDVKDWVPGDIQSDMIGTPITISSAKINASNN